MSSISDDAEDMQGFDDDGQFDPEDGDDGFEQFDCGAMRDMNHHLVGCEKAGSEECDFECPYRGSVERSLRAQDGWARRKAKKVKSDEGVDRRGTGVR